MDALPPLPPRYRGRALLGEGATGIVWLADDLLLEHAVAVKVVRPNLAIHRRFRARFSREVALSASVVHPRIVPVYDHGRLEDGRPFVTLAYARFGCLSDLLRMRPPLELVLRIIDEVLDALSALHARGLVHQDLKPANVLLHGEDLTAPSAWVADLGVAGAISELTMDRRGISGTPGWMAPEQLAGRAQELGPWTDLYAVGLLLRDVLGPAEAGAAGSGEAPSGSGVGLAGPVPASLRQIIQNLLEEDPRQRYDRAADVRRALAVARGALSADGLSQASALDSRHTASLLNRTTTFPEELLPEARDPVSAPRRAPADPRLVPRWNRVLPGPLPPEPSPEPGLGEGAGTSPSLFALREPPILVREPVRRKLWTLAARVVQSGEPAVVLLIGASDSGKSRIVESVARALEEGGYMEAVCLRYNEPAGVDDGYRGAVQDLLVPWNDTRFEAEHRLARWLARDRQSTPEAVAGEAAALARWCGYGQPGERPVNAAVGLAFLYRHLEARAWRGGACLVVEDAHLAEVEGDGLDLCEALLDQSVGERPVFVMATLSEEALGESPRLAARVAGMEERGAVVLRASRFTPEEMTTYLESGVGLDPELARSFGPVCQGSPSTALLLLRDGALRGLLVGGADRLLCLREGLTVDDLLPEDGEDLYQRRVAGALQATEDPEAAEQALAGAALAGPEPPTFVVRGLNLEGLDSLLATGIVRQVGRRLVFEGAGVHRAAFDRAVRRPDVAALHGRLADAWENLGRYTGADVDLPHGRHRVASGNADRAVTPLLRAARTTQVEGRPALSYFAAALARVAADQSGVTMARAEARQRMAEALLELDRPEEAEQVLAEAEKVGALDRRSRARLSVLGARAAIAQGDLERGRKLLDQAATAFETMRDWAGLVDTAHGEGILYRLEGRPDAALDRYARMLRLNQGADPRAEVQALVGLVECRLATGRLGDVETDVATLRRIALASGDTRNIAAATYAAGLVHLRRRRIAAAEKHFLTARAIAATLGSDRLRLATENHLGEVARFRGDYREAARAYRSAARLGVERGWPAVVAVAKVYLGQLALLEEQHEAAREAFEEAARLLTAHKNHWVWLPILLARALFSAAAGDEAATRRHWAAAKGHGLGTVRSPDLWLLLERCSTVCALQGWKDLAREAMIESRRVARAEVPDEVGVDIDEGEE